MAITALPDPPSRSDPANFPERADAFMAALPGFAAEANALAEQVDDATATAGEYKDAAGSSATEANGSAANALLSETHAQGSAAAAAQARVDSQAARDLAKDWASKASGTVDGTPFLSAKQYAELAAAGAGLPIYSPIPTANEGLIAAPDQGVMQWDPDALRYYSVQPLHGQCRLVYVSANECRLMPKDGNGLIINGRQYRIDPAGLPLSSSQTAASGQYYVYAKGNGNGGALSGAGVLDVAPVTTASHSAYTDGVEIITGDPSKTLVGYVALNPLNQFLDGAPNRRVVSWFNKRLRWAVELLSGSTASQTFVGIGNGVSLFAWAGDSFQAHAIIAASNTNAATGVFFHLRKDGSQWSVQGSATVPGAQYGVMIPLENVDDAAAIERLMAFQMFASVNGGTMNYTFKYMIGVWI